MADSEKLTVIPDGGKIEDLFNSALNIVASEERLAAFAKEQETVDWNRQVDAKKAAKRRARTERRRQGKR